MNIKTIAKNPTAYHNYIIEDKIETGIVLSGTEIKSIRNGKINLKDTYAQIKNGEIFVIARHIRPYEHGNILKKYPRRIEMLHIKDEFVIGESGTINFEAIFNQFYKNGMKNYVVEIETPKALREKTNADGSKYTKEQIMNEMFVAAQKSAAYLTNAKFVK